jgi:hypothetical protein
VLKKLLPKRDSLDGGGATSPGIRSNLTMKLGDVKHPFWRGRYQSVGTESGTPTRLPDREAPAALSVNSTSAGGPYPLSTGVDAPC